jgi:hypothetical protein
MCGFPAVVIESAAAAAAGLLLLLLLLLLGCYCSLVCRHHFCCCSCFKRLPSRCPLLLPLVVMLQLLTCHGRTAGIG